MESLISHPSIFFHNFHRIYPYFCKSDRNLSTPDLRLRRTFCKIWILSAIFRRTDIFHEICRVLQGTQPLLQGYRLFPKGTRAIRSYPPVLPVDKAMPQPESNMQLSTTYPKDLLDLQLPWQPEMVLLYERNNLYRQIRPHNRFQTVN